MDSSLPSITGSIWGMVLSSNRPGSGTERSGTLLATFAANRFWEMQQRFRVENSFFEYLGLIGRFLPVVWPDLRASHRASIGVSYAQPQHPK